MTYSGGRMLRQGSAFERMTQAEYFDHFMELDCLSRWNTLETDGGATVEWQTTGRGGVVNLQIVNTLNDEAYMYSPAVFKWNGDLPMVFQGRMVSDMDTGDLDLANAWVAGFNAASVFGAGDLIADGGLGLGVTTGDPAMFFKPNGTEYLSVCTATSASTVQITETDSKQQVDPAGGNVPFISLRIEVFPRGDENFDVVYSVDEGGELGFQQCRDRATNKPIKHSMFYDPSSAMAIGCGIKLGETNDTCLLRVDAMGGIVQAARRYGDTI